MEAGEANPLADIFWGSGLSWFPDGLVWSIPHVKEAGNYFGPSTLVAGSRPFSPSTPTGLRSLRSRRQPGSSRTSSGQKELTLGSLRGPVRAAVQPVRT